MAGYSPITINNDTITIQGEHVKEGIGYNFEYHGKKFVLYRPNDKVTQIYEVKNKK